MKWGLTQGILGRSLLSLAPSARAVGPNTYLGEGDFVRMLILAVVVHGLVMAGISLWPKDTVTDIPVRALSFKLGDQDRVAAYGRPAAAVPTQPVLPAAPVMQASSGWKAEPVSVPKPQPLVKPVKQALVAPSRPPARQMPAENPPPSLAPLPAPFAAPAIPAIAATPQQYVREVGAAPQNFSQLPSPAVGPVGVQNGAIGGQGTQTTMTAQTEQEVRTRYEQQISSWVEQHKLYPAAANGREGRSVVRMRIDRRGYVRYCALEQSSGNDALDAAAVDIIRRANPLPAAPDNYPAGNLIEFLIPITFRAPR